MMVVAVDTGNWLKEACFKLAGQFRKDLEFIYKEVPVLPLLMQD
jgi:hypothetical protein